MAGEEGLNLRTKRPRRRKAAAHRMERPEISTVNQCWSMDFVADQLFDGRKIRVFVKGGVKVWRGAG